MRLAVACLAAACLVAVASPAGAAGPDATVAYETAAETCRHYDNRARFKPREGAVDFTAVLADGCRIALGTVADPSADGRLRDAAARFLDRLADGRAEVALINRRRVADASGALRVAAADGRGPVDLARALGLVTPTGEFLILRAEGVFGALRGWVAAGADFALAGALGERRAPF